LTLTTRERLERMSSEQALAWFAKARPYWHERVAALRSSLLNGEKRKSDRTREQYAEDAKRVAKADYAIAAVAGCAKSFYKLRAAAEWKAREDLRELLNKADGVRKKNPGNPGEFAQLCIYEDGIENIVRRLEKLSAQKWQEVKADARPKATSRNQRQKLGRLPKDWIPRIFARMSKGKGGAGKYKDACALSIVAGMRPDEVAQGVTVKVVPGGLSFLIHGAKVTKASKSKAKGKNAQASDAADRGQPDREFVILAVPADKQGAFDHLKAVAAAAGGSAKLCAKLTASGYSSAFSAASGREFARMDSPPSAYALRHRFSADMKAAGVDPQGIAKAMGHAAESSQGHYGTKAQGKGGLQIEQITATREVRSAPPSPRPPSLSRPRRPKPK
jgi:hypothetical protein